MRKIILPSLHFNIERWRYNAELDCYVSTEGRIKDNKGILQSFGKTSGYLCYKGRNVHRIVMETWKPTPGYAFLTVDHLDRNTCNNSLRNLAWLDAKANAEKASKEDKANLPGMTEISALSGETMFRVNGAPMTFDAAKAMMQADKHLDKCANINRAFANAYNSSGTITSGGYTIQRYTK